MRWKIVLAIAPCLAIASVDEEEDTAGFHTYVNQDYDFSIDYPSNWEESERGLQEYEVVKFLSPDGTLGIVEIFIFSSEPSTNLYDLVDTAGGNTRIISTVNTTIGGIPAVEQVYYQYESGITAKAKDALILRDNHDFIQIRYQVEPEDFDESATIFDQMVDSFKMGLGLQNN